MSLATDAISVFQQETLNYIQFSNNRIVMDVLEEMKNDLDIEEIISIIFLMVDTDTKISQIIEKLEKDPIAAFSELYHINNWAEKLLEALLIIGNINVIIKLGYSRDEIEKMKKQFIFDVHNVSLHLNRVIKSLYFLCNELNVNKAKKLINEVDSALTTKIKIENNECLELYILHWLKQKYITIDKNPNLNNLIENLKKIGCLNDFSVAFNFEDWKTNGKYHQCDSTENNSLKSYSNDQCIQRNKNIRNCWNAEHKRLCIIINEVNFERRFGNKPRLGSEKDLENLETTFRGCSFDVEKFSDLKKSDVIALLNKFNECKYSKYDSIFICILSHGYEGAIYFSDDEISLKTIKEKFCCPNLQDVFKCIIVQACRGKIIGMKNIDSDLDESSKLVVDGPTNNPLSQLNFALFQATVNDYAAIRDESKGSWFIQSICDVLRQSSPMTVNQLFQKVIKHVSSRSGKTKNENLEVVQLPCLTEYTATDDYMIPAYKE